MEETPNSTFWAKVQSLFTDALQLPEADRAAFLARECAGNSLLYDEVQSLLQNDLGEGDLPATFQMAAAAMVADESFLGQRAGPYQIISELGRGGMGAVYRAVRVDDEFRKQVAIKVVKRGMDTDAMLNRFRAERQILADLDHPYIARLLDGGSVLNRPFLVMELVEGQPLDVYCREQNLSIEDRCRLFLKICDGVAFAHRNLVIHRDLKPGNILITSSGTPKLLDFGLAKLLTAQEGSTATATRAAHRMMTPEYASPEYIMGRPSTTATDVYSLAAIFYELVSGQRAHNLPADRPEEWDRIICNQDAAPFPARLRAKVGDLETVLLKGLRKEPERRYLSVEQLAADLERYLNRMPVQARPDTVTYRSAKFLRRNRIWVAAGTMVAASLVGAVIVSFRETAKAREALRLTEISQQLASTQRNIAENSRSEADRQRQRAENALAVARRRSDDQHHLATDVLLKLNVSMRNLPGATTVRTEAIKASTDYLDRLAADSAGNESLLQDVAYSYAELADITGNPSSSNNGDIKGALLLYEKSVRIYQDLLRRNPGDASIRAALGKTLNDQSYTMFYAGRKEEGEKVYHRALEVLTPAARSGGERTLDLANAVLLAGVYLQSNPAKMLEQATWAQRLLEMPQATPGAKKRRMVLLPVAFGMASKAKDALGDREGGLEAAKKAVAVQEQLLGESPADLGLARELIMGYTAVGDRLLVNETPDGRFADLGSLQYYRHAHDLALETWKSDPADRRAQFNVAIPAQHIGEALHLRGDERGASEAFQESIDLLEKIIGVDPNNNYAMMFLGRGSNKLAQSLEVLGEPDRASSAYRRSIEIARKLWARTPGDGSVFTLLTDGEGGLANLEAGHGSVSTENLIKDLNVAVETLQASSKPSADTQVRLFRARALAALALQKLAEGDSSPARRSQAQESLQNARLAWDAVPPKDQQHATPANRGLAALIIKATTR